MGIGVQAPNVGAWYCTTERQNTHVTDRREVLYPWHPLSGQSVFVHDVIDKPGDAVFRCNLTARRSDRLLEVPVWMFDRAACVACRWVDMAHVGLDTLTGLAELVRDADFTALDKSDSSSRAGAALDSEPTIRRSPNAAQNEDDATRAVPKHPVHDRGTNSALAELARRHAANADTVDGTSDGGTRMRGGRGGTIMKHEKIGPQHLERKALLYVRQSSAHQVLHNRESSALQYAMRDRLSDLGWGRIETVDEDLGRSAAGGVAREGFDRMIADVCLGKVGAVAAREVSRFARNRRDWQHLIEMCRVVDTVLIDQETVYAPRDGNDRLLLGLKGSLNEYEFDLLRQRTLAARQEKARRGELVVAAPVGFVKAGYRLEKDPDRRVQEAITLVFDKVAELGSA